jgi:predicted nuclease of predicted toxin-antitoxin system
MRILADENFPKPVIDVLRAEGHDVLWARTGYSGCKDAVLLELAESQARVVLTLDKDFGRLHATPESVELLVRAFVDAEKAWAGHVSIIAPGGIQMLSSRRD